MDTKWKNISRQCLLWLGIVVILVVTVLGSRDTGTKIFSNIREYKGGEDSYASIDMRDVINGYFTDGIDNSYEKKMTREFYSKVSRDIFDYYLTGTEKNVLKEIPYSMKMKRKSKKTEIFGTKDIPTNGDDSQKGILAVCNMNPVFEKNDDDSHYIVDGVFFDKDGNEVGEYSEPFYESTYGREKFNKLKDVTEISLQIQLPKAELDRIDSEWGQMNQIFKEYLNRMYLYIGMILAALVAIVLAASPSQRSRAGEWLDHIWLEILLFAQGIMIVGVFGLGFLAAILLVEMDQVNILHNLAWTGMLISEFIFLFGFVSIVRRIKEKNLIHSLACYKIIHFTKKTAMEQKEEWDYWKNKQSSMLTVKEKEMKRKKMNLILVLIAGVFGTLAGLIVFFPLGILFGAVLFLIFRKSFTDYQKDMQDLLDLEKVLQQIYEISNGNLNATTDISEDSLYYKATKDLEGIGHGMARSVEEQMKGERMKIDLITNVSHDLKTPLTSIIGYVDLLSKDDNLSDEARDYVEILGRKAESLKHIVTDLFDLAKSTSGNADVKYSTLDMCRLVEQIIAEMDDRIESSGFEIVRDYRVEQALFEGDADRMYRVVQNILENALKYSLKGSRIFISIDDTGNEYRLSMKNTASYHMTFSEKEVLERFTRGDQARTTEGSGLGLSIAESFTNLCGGEFDVKIDGDQFTVNVIFAKKDYSE